MNELDTLHKETEQMEEHIAALEQAFAAYRQDLEESEKKHRLTDGLFGFGSSLKDDPCHERLDRRVEKTVARMASCSPSPESAECALQMLLLRDRRESWPLSAEWMLCAIERHSIPLIPFLSPEKAAVLMKEYAARYKPWDRLPAQKQVLRELKRRASAS